MSNRIALLQYRQREYRIAEPRGIHRVPDDKELESLKVLKERGPPMEYDPVSLSLFWNNGGSPAIPPFPNGAYVKPFPCPYCGFEILVRGADDWARHIFQDIAPYVCVFPKCHKSERLFNSRIQQSDHLAHWHRSELDDIKECPLCRKSIQDGEFVEHMAVHQERLALVALREIPSIGEVLVKSFDLELPASDAEQGYPRLDYSDTDLGGETVRQALPPLRQLHIEADSNKTKSSPGPVALI